MAGNLPDRERLVLGIDIGGSKTVVVLGRATGEILAESRLDQWASGSWEKDVSTLAEHARVLMRGSGVPLDRVHALGLCSPGPLNPHTGIVHEAPNLPGWVDVPLVQKMYESFGVQVLLENDANAAALAEWRFGAGRGARTQLYLTMSTGIGAGLVLDGRLYRGAHFQAGEVGHMPITSAGRACPCGLSGCLEAYAGGAGLAQRIREDVARGDAGAILELAGGNADDITARHWVEALRAGDRYAQGLRHDFLDALSQGLAMLILTLDPERIVLGTIIQHNPDLFLDELRERVARRTWSSLHEVRIEIGELGDRLPAYAALSVATLEPEHLEPTRGGPPE